MKIINKIKVKFLVLILLLGLLLPYSCTENFEEYNTDKTELMEVGPKQLSGLFSMAQYQGCNWLTTDNYARMSIGVGLHLCGYISSYFTPQENNELRKGWCDSGFEKMYSKGIPPLQQVISITEANEGYDKEHAVALIWKVWMLHQVTDLWGPIPYANAGSGDETVPYDSQKDVYYQMFDDLDEAVNALNDALDSDSNANAFGGGDLIYSGDVKKWVKFANTLRLRLAIRISNIEPSKAKTEAEAAVAGETMDTNDDDALLAVETLERGNGIPRVAAWYQTLMTSSMESVMKGYQDPRMQEFFSIVEDDESFHVEGYPEELAANVGGYHGMANGYETSIEKAYFKSYSNYGPRFQSEYQYVTPINIMHSAETYFLKAEGAWLGWNMGGTAEEFYEKGIEVSIVQWREDNISSDSIQSYINSTNVPVAPNNYLYYDEPMTDIPVKFATDSEKQYEQILTQKWLALWPISFEAYSEYRRTRLPKIYAKKHSSNADIDLSKGMIVTRLTYTDDEYASQPEEVGKAISLLYNGNEDNYYTPLWWDTNTNGN